MSMDAKTQEMMDRMTAAVIDSIEAGLADPKGWVAPWHKSAGAVNATTKRRYTGGNFLWLTIVGGGPWATYKQWEGVGATVRKGEKGTPILVPIPVKFVKKDADNNEKTVRFTRFRVAHVFHAGQVDGWTAPETPVNTDDRVSEVESLIEAWSKIVPISHGGDSAYYVPSQDAITVPAFESFKNSDGYYSTMLHEMGHSTGHPTRCNRTGGMFGTPSYAREELVAEFTSAFLGSHFGISTGVAQHNLDYLSNWLQVLKNDSTLLWDAASDAQKAVATLLATVGE